MSDAEFLFLAEDRVRMHTHTTIELSGREDVLAVAAEQIFEKLGIKVVVVQDGGHLGTLFFSKSTWHVLFYCF